MNLFRLTSFALPLLLLACSTGETPTISDEQEQAIVLPSEKMIGLNALPRSLTEVKPIAEDLDTYFSLSKAAKHKALKAQQGKKNLKTFTEQEIDYDPFKTVLENKTDSNCGQGQIYLPDMHDTQSSPNAFCLVAIAKLAIHRGIAHYSNFNQLLPEIVEELLVTQTPMGTEHTYTQTTAIASGTNGFTVKIFYDSCAAIAAGAIPDDDGLAFCATAPIGARYYRAKVYPLSPTRQGLTTDTVIGKMEWSVDLNENIHGEMVISRDLMTNIHEFYTPLQMQFEFDADSSGEFKDITIRLERNIDRPLENVYTHEWNANVLHVSRIPETETDPAVWTVRGNLKFKLDLSNNPAINDSIWPGPPSYDLHKTAEPRIFFTAVAHDAFMDGNAVFNAILSDGSGLDHEAYPPTSWMREFHLWAAYKKLLEYHHSQEHYLNEHRLAELSGVHLFEKDTANLVRWLALEGHSDTIHALDLSPNGHQLASVSRDGNVFIWDVNPASVTYGQVLHTFQGMTGGEPLHSVKYHPSNNDIIAYGSENGSVRIMQISTQTQITSVAPGIISPVWYKVMVNWSDDGSRIVTASDTGVKVWNATTGAEIADLFDGIARESRTAIFYPGTNNAILSGHDSGDVHRWNLAAPATPERTFEQFGATAIFDLDFAPDGITFVAVSQSGPLYIWDINNDTSPQSTFIPDVGHSTRYALKAQYSVDGSKLFLQSNNEMIVYTIATAKSEVIYVGEGGDDKTDGLISFELNADESMILVGHNGAVNAPQLSVDIEGYNVQTRSITPKFKGHDGNVNMGEFSPDDSQILTASNDHTARLWNTADGTLLRTFSGHTDWVHSAKFNSDGSRVVTASSDGTVRVWDTNTGLEVFSSIVHGTEDVRYAEFSPDDSLIISGGDAGYVRGWDANTGAPSGFNLSLTGNSEYQWQQSVTNPNEYYLLRTSNLIMRGGSPLAGLDPFFSEPDFLWISAVEAQNATVGTLAANQWGFGDNDTLGFNTVYINLGGTDPNTLNVDDITVQHILEMFYTRDIDGVYFTIDDPTLFFFYSNFGDMQLRSFHNMDAPRCILDTSNDTKGVLTADGKTVIAIDDFWGTEFVSIDPTTNPSEFCDPPTFGGDEIDTPFRTNHAFTSADGNELFISEYLGILRYDFDPLSPTYLQLLTPGTYRDTRGIGPLTVFETDTYVPDRKFQHSDISSDESLLLVTDDILRYDPNWSSFDAYFDEQRFIGVDEHGQPIMFTLPDENDDANPYYVDTTVATFTQPIWDPETQQIIEVTHFRGCMEFEVDELGNGMCRIFCRDVGGCKTYTVKSQRDYDLAGETPDPEKFGYLRQQLDTLEFLFDDYIEQVID